VRDIVFDLGFEDVVEMKWWDQVKVGELTMTHTPSNHWGARVIRDMHRGFGGYVLANSKQSLYHAGDTAFFDGFTEIGKRLHPEIALLPIGAYDPPSFRAVHTSPEDAMQAFVDLKSKRMIPMHYGTFKLSHEPMDEPVKRLLADAKRRGIEDKISVLEEGVTEFF
jgi:L-ascorbate metabolism protein UlaG (beta-lactamase superfamily)